MIRVLVRAAVVAVLLSPALVGQASQPPGGAAPRVLGIGILRPEVVNPRQPTGPMTYHNGPVMRAMSRTYSIFWRPPGAFMDPNYQALINRYFQDVGGSALYNITTQYTDAGGAIVNNSQLGGTWVDQQAYPAATLTLAQVLIEIEHAIAVNNWPRTVNDAFFLYLARGENACITFTVNGHLQHFGCFVPQAGQPSWCAVHAGFDVPAYHAVLIGALMPYAGTNLQLCGPQTIGRAVPNNNPDADAEISITSHEHLEAVTDPFDLGAHLSGVNQGWYDTNIFEGEIADLCAWQFGARAPDGGNITMNGHRYLVQKEYSNNLHACTI